MLKILAIGALIAAFVSPVAVDDPPADPPADRPSSAVVIDALTMNGTGCGLGAVDVSIRADNSAFYVNFSNYQAGVGPGLSIADQRRNCQLALAIHAPQGYTYAVASADYQGFVSIAEGASARYRTVYYFQGQLPSVSQIRTITGPADGEFAFTDLTDLAALVWAPCGAVRPLNINTEVRVSAGTSDVQHLTSTASLNRAGAFTLQWRRCG